jgi:hypothetical protein
MFNAIVGMSYYEHVKTFRGLNMTVQAESTLKLTICVTSDSYTNNILHDDAAYSVLFLVVTKSLQSSRLRKTDIAIA